MRNNFATLTLALVLTIPASISGQDGPASPTPDPRPPSPSLLADAAQRLAREPAISAELRYRVDAYGQELIGAGYYLQLASGGNRLLKLELKMQVGDKPALFQEIRGDDFYWIRRDIPPNPPWLGRVNLRQLRGAVDPSVVSPTADLLPNSGWIVLGGLPRLLSALDQGFAFEAPQAEELQHYAADGQTVESSPIWRISGRWKPDRLKAFAGRDIANAADLPEQVPDQVEIILGRTEKLVLLFPYRITYWRTPKIKKRAGQPAETPEPRQLLSLDLFNVSRRDIDKSEFRFDTGNLDILDLTTVYIQRAGAPTKLR